jgi:hypothetical protein
MMARKGSIKVSLEGRGQLVLRETDYVTSGGEGAIYRSASTIIKLYTDPDKMQRDGMPDKIKMLARLQHAGIVAPQGLALDESRNPIGFFMPFSTGEPMSRVFVSDFRTRTGFADRDAISVAHSMYGIVNYAHAKQALMVDANELNWLVTFTKGASASATVIDVDSWAIGRWPATVIMPSIRDWKAKDFGLLTDWFAWGIVSFQVFTGIHPFKGKIDGYKPGNLVERMRNNASVFDKRARLPLSVRDFSCIPGPLLDWYQATFQQGSRTAPPSPLDTSRPAKAAQIMRAVTTAVGGALIFEKLFERAGDPAVRVWANGAARLASGDVCDLATGGTIGGMQRADSEIVRLPEGWLIAIPTASEVFAGHVSEDLQQRTLDRLPIASHRVFRAGERIFAITDREMVEIEVRNLGKPVITLGRRWQIMVNSTTWLDDVAVQDTLGAAFVILPHGDGVHQVRAPELDGAKIVAGKAGGRFAAFTTVKPDGTYGKIELTFDKAFTTYTAWTGPADSAELNMGILPRGVVGTIVNDFELAIVVPTTGAVNKIRDTGVSTAMKLAAWGEKLVYILDGAVWQLRVGP